MIKELIEIMRPKQWYKNLVIFAAIFFSVSMLNVGMLVTTSIGFIALCLLSSGSYAINDIVDAKSDKSHDKKKYRPIPSSRLSKPVAFIWAIILYAIGFSLSYLVGLSFLAAGAALVTLTQLYNFLFKNIAFADISVLSTNFMIRAVAGALAIAVTISPWLILGTYLLALFLSIAKRKTDLESLGNKAKEYKRVYEVYTVELLDRFLLMAATLLFICYCLYSFLGAPVKNNLYLMATIPIVFFLIFRYYHLASMKHEIARSPEKVFRDIQMVLGMLLWLIIFSAGLYIK